MLAEAKEANATGVLCYPSFVGDVFREIRQIPGNPEGTNRPSLLWLSRGLLLPDPRCSAVRGSVVFNHSPAHRRGWGGGAHTAKLATALW